METNNLVLLRGTLSSEPVERELPSGARVTKVELRTQVDATTVSVPVAVHDRTVTVGAGDEVVVTGYVRRRVFRAGGITQSRTEVIAGQIVKTSRRRTVERALTEVIDTLSTARTPRSRHESHR